MDDLISALQILRKYGNPSNPTHCEHDELTIRGIKPKDVSEEDIKKLDNLGFFVSSDDEDGDWDGQDEDEDEEKYFMSFKFGSA